MVWSPTPSLIVVVVFTVVAYTPCRAIAEPTADESAIVDSTPPVEATPEPAVVPVQPSADEPMELPDGLKPRLSMQARTPSPDRPIVLVAVGWSLFGLGVVAAGWQAIVFAAYGVDAGWFHLVPAVGPAIAGTAGARKMRAPMVVAGWSTALAQSGGLTMAIVGMVRLKHLRRVELRQSWGVLPRLGGAMAYYQLRL